jgi:acetyl/propionyl-CoA carboxylase alpha subunit
MIAKLIAWGESRDEARRRAVAALGQFPVEGIRTNRDFLIACLDHAGFERGDVHTGFIDAHRKELLGS